VEPKKELDSEPQNPLKIPPSFNQSMDEGLMDESNEGEETDPTADAEGDDESKESLFEPDPSPHPAGGEEEGG
jgi:hypothetical protein